MVYGLLLFMFSPAHYLHCPLEHVCSFSVTFCDSHFFYVLVAIKKYMHIERQRVTNFFSDKLEKLT
jgi:hypothetical protein